MVKSPSNAHNLLCREIALFFVGSGYICLSFLGRICYLELSFKQKRIDLFCINCIFVLFFLLTRRYQKYMPSQICGLIKKIHNNLRNFGFRSSFYWYKYCNFVLIFLRDFVTIDYPLILASRQQLRYSTVWNDFILLLLYVLLSADFFPIEKNTVSFILTIMNRHLIIIKPLAHIRIFLFKNNFDLCNVFIFPYFFFTSSNVY